MTTVFPPRLAGTAAWYAASIRTFLAEPDDAVLGAIASESSFSIELDQRNAWQREIQILRSALAGLEGWVFLEFDVPRLGTRIDAVVLTGGALIPIEFKVGEREHHRAALDQTWDYGLDLKNFHKASHHAEIFPVLVATEAEVSDRTWPPRHDDGVRPPRRCNATSLAEALGQARTLAAADPIDGAQWGKSPYHPTPTIVEAARALYSRHSVESISRSDADATNLTITSQRVETVIDEASRSRSKAIVFVTGVPGAGKTLVGLNLATRKRGEGQTHAVYLSGNGPLVDVLREALTRDEFLRCSASGNPKRKGAIAQPVKQFIQNVHHFRDAGLHDGTRPPTDHVVIFDESQRAWTQERTQQFMRRRKNRPNFEYSEPEFLISYLDRHADWAVIVCLVGGGQEINLGEAGIGSWLEAVHSKFPTWRVFVSPNLSDSEYGSAGALAALERESRVIHDASLHLAVSMRTFRSENVSNFVKAVLGSDVAQARSLLAAFQPNYPIALTRNLERARTWTRDHARGSERYGLVASSSAERLKPHAIDVRVDVDPVHYFLGDASDTRSSYYLEDAATEFQIQGLELDWICLSWDADLRRVDDRWSFHSFRGDRWTMIRKPERQRFLVNAYRVLLTRARQGMVIFVPPGERRDPTRLPELYDSTYRYLAELGLEILD